jgi:hypothetical protein
MPNEIKVYSLGLRSNHDVNNGSQISSFVVLAPLPSCGTHMGILAKPTIGFPCAQMSQPLVLAFVDKNYVKCDMPKQSLKLNQLKHRKFSKSSISFSSPK